MTRSDDQRKALVSKARRIVVKVGSAVLASHRGLDLQAVAHLANGLSALQDKGLEVVLVSSGAVAAGRGRAAKSGMQTDTSDLPGRQAASAIGQGRLMHEYDEALAKLGKVSAQILLTRDGLRDRKRFLNARNTLRRLLDWKAIPIINENDTVSVEELEFGDNDTLASMMIGLIDADLFVNLTSANGVYDRNPDKNPGAKPLQAIDNIGSLDIETMCDGKTSVGSGGMYSKLRAARRAAQLGVPTLILSGCNDDNLENMLSDDSGTLVIPNAKSVSLKKFWLAYHADPVGSVTVDKGAENALRQNGKSLLPAGIVSVDDDFAKDALVAIRNGEGNLIGVGLTGYDSAELNRIKGKRTAEIETILEREHCPAAIHRDNMFLDPAI